MEDSDDQSLSIAIVCYHTPAAELIVLLRSLLVAIQKLNTNNLANSVKIYLIDNSETSSIDIEEFQPLQAELDAQKAEVRLIHGHGNVGYGAGHNLALSRINSDYHLLLNPDLTIEENCLVRGIHYLSQHESTVMVSPNALDDLGNKQYLCKRYPSVLIFLMRGFFPGFLRKLFAKSLARFEMRDLSESEPGIDIPIVSGCFMLWKTEALKRLEGFNEDYFLYFEDFDLSLRAAKIGRLDYLPEMQIQHCGGNAARKGLSHLKMFVRSGVRFFNTHGWRFF